MNKKGEMMLKNSLNNYDISNLRVKVKQKASGQKLQKHEGIDE